MSIYNQRLKGLLQLINKLRDLGGNANLSLPTVVVCGNQSVGKSSVIQSLCGIPLPRGSGTCTRCVIEIRLIQESTWKCRLKLRTEYDALGNKLNEPTECSFGPDISNPLRVESFIRLAQKALLNPSQHYSSFLNHELSSEPNQLRFTRNVICVQVYGSYTNLTLVDLPGIIHTVENKEDKHVIEDIQQLVKEYTLSERTIILAVISCKDEIENQAIFHIARQADPLGSRTVGILTKPDTIEQGNHKQWAEIMLGNQYFLKAGYYMVKCMSKHDMIKTIENTSQGDFLADAKLAEEMEANFFATNDPWPSLKLKCNRFGIPILRNEVGKMLAALIFKSLPDIKSAIFSSIDEAKNILKSIPPKLMSDPKLELFQLVRQFSTLFKSHLNAGPGFKSFNQKVRRHFAAFAESMRETRPKLIYTESRDYGNVGNFLYGKKEDDMFSVTTSEFTVSQIKAIVNSQKGRELDGMYPYGAFEAIILKCQDSWKHLTIALFQNISIELSTLVNGLCCDIFARFSDLNGQIRAIMNVIQSDVEQESQNQLYHIIKTEQRAPFTMNTSAYMQSRQEAKDALLIKNHEPSFSNDKATAHKFAKAINILGDLGFPGVTSSALTGLLNQSSNSGIESYLTELFSSAQGYMNISLQRVIDNVCMCIEYHLLDRLGDVTEQLLITKSGILEKDSKQLEHLLKEDDAVVEKRQIAQDRYERLVEISKMLAELESRPDNS